MVMRRLSIKGHISTTDRALDTVTVVVLLRGTLVQAATYAVNS